MSTAEPYLDGNFWLDPMTSGLLPFIPVNSAQFDLQYYHPLLMASPSRLNGMFQPLSTISSNCDPSPFDTHGVGTVVDATNFTRFAHNEVADSWNDTTTPDAIQSPEVQLDSPQPSSRHSAKTIRKSKGNTKTMKAKQKQKCQVQEPRVKSAKRQIKKIASRERNRASAFVARTKSKECENNLESKKRALESKHRTLRAEYARLLRETLDLKNDVISHASCQDDKIDAWISSEARKFVRKLSNAEKQALDNNSLPPTDSGGMFIYHDIMVQQLQQPQWLASLPRCQKMAEEAIQTII